MSCLAPFESLVSEVKNTVRWREKTIKTLQTKKEELSHFQNFTATLIFIINATTSDTKPKHVAEQMFFHDQELLDLYHDAASKSDFLEDLKDLYERRKHQIANHNAVIQLTQEHLQNTKARLILYEKNLFHARRTYIVAALSITPPQ